MYTYHIPKQLYFVKNKFIFLFLYLGLCPPLCVLTQHPSSFTNALRAVGKVPFGIDIKEPISSTGSDKLRKRLHLVLI